MSQTKIELLKLNIMSHHYSACKCLKSVFLSNWEMSLPFSCCCVCEVPQCSVQSVPIWQPLVCIGSGCGQEFVNAKSFTSSWEHFFSRIMWRRKGHFQKGRQLSAPLLKILRYGCGEISARFTCFYLWVNVLWFFRSFVNLSVWRGGIHK